MSDHEGNDCHHAVLCGLREVSIVSVLAIMHVVKVKTRASGKPHFLPFTLDSQVESSRSKAALRAPLLIRERRLVSAASASTSGINSTQLNNPVVGQECDCCRCC